MAKLTTALLMATYLAFSITFGVVLWRGGSDSGACVAGIVAALGLFIGIHSMVTLLIAEQRLVTDLDQVRQAHRLMADALEVTQGEIMNLSEQVDNQANHPSQSLTTEVKMLESLVLKLSDRIEDRLSQIQITTAAPAPTRPGAKPSSALIETIREALIENRVDLYLQPVVSLPQRKTLYYESFSRLRDVTGRVMMPAEYLSIADAEGLIPSIDNLLLFRCVQIVRRLAKQDRRIGIFCNISLTSLRDETFFPQFLEFMHENKDLASSVIFELGQEAFESRTAVEARNMAKLGDLGFRFSIDKVVSIDFDLNDLQRSDVRFVKIGVGILADQLINIEGKPALKYLKDIHAGDYGRLLSRYGIEAIAEKVENERQVVDILEIEIGFGQGHLFGEPRAIKEQILAETDPPAGFARSTLPSVRRRAA